MKTHLIRETIREKGDLQGVIFVLEAINEKVNNQQKTIVELAKLLSGMQDTMMNVVDGVHGMKGQMLKTLAAKGLLSGPEDDLGDNTLAIGKDKP